MNKSKVYEIREIPHTSRKKGKAPLEYFTIPYKNNKYMIYFPLKGIVSLVNKSFVDNIDTNDEVVKALFELISKQKNAEMLKVEDEMDKTNSIALEPTSACNLNCIYCYTDGGDNPKYMKWETAKTAIDYMIKKHKTKKNKEEIFMLEFSGGGEPFLAFDIMKKCCKYMIKKCDKYYIKYELYSITNGTLLTEDIVKWIKKNDLFIKLSFDGLPDIQNKQRPFRDGSDSYDTVKKSIELMNKYKVRYGVNSIITKNVVHEMKNIVENSKKLGIKKQRLTCVVELGRCKKNKVRSPDAIKFQNNYKKAEKIAKKHNIKLLKTINLKPKTLCTNKESCSSCGHVFIVSSEGYILPCLAFTNIPNKKSGLDNEISKVMFYGKIKDGKIIINKNRLNYLRNRIVDNIPQCKNCWAKYFCRGNCARITLKKTGPTYKISGKKCLQAKERYKNYLIDILNE